MHRFITILTIAFCILNSNGFSQKVGLVLSGGGAKGIAHIGAIRALEEHNIPIDYIAGTSMGAIVGGLYAIGYSPDEMEALITSEDFLRWSYGYIDIDNQFYYKQKNEHPDWVEIDFKSIDGDLIPQFPTNIIAPEQMDLRFMQFYAPGSAAANYDFSQLMVPFFCVATDVHKNCPVILTHGNLSASIRASMTFPGYFKPISIDSVLLFDGGMENNFPSDIMQEKYNPDILIGVKVAYNPEKPDSDDIYQQLENVFMKNTNYEMPENGILIEPQVKNFGLLDFDKFDTLTTLGYQATLKRIDSIEQMVERRMPNSILKNKREAFKSGYKSLTFENIYITGTHQQTVDYILKNIKRNREVLTFEEFEEEYFKLLSDKLIKSIYPKAIYNPISGHFDLYLDIKTKNEFTVKVGGNLSTNIRNVGFMGVDYIFQKKNVYNLSGNMMIGKFYNSAQGKFRIDFPPRSIRKDKTLSPYYIDILATTHKWDFFSTTNEWFVDSEEPSKVVQYETHFKANFGRPLGNRGLFYTGFSYGQSTDNYFHTHLIEQKDEPDETTFDYSSIHASVEYNTLDYKQYASKGRKLFAQARYVTGSEGYEPGTTAIPYNAEALTAGHSWFNLNVTYERYYGTNHWMNLGIKTQLNYTNKSPFTNSIATLLNARAFEPFPQSEVVFLEGFRGHTWAAAGIIPVITFTERLHLRTEGYVFQPYQYISTKTFKPSSSETFPTPRIMASAAAVYHSPIGPLALTGSYFMGEEHPFYFQLNFGYILFNKKGTE